jgi:hypothetical protein
MQEIKYLRHHEIDKTKWDECIFNAPNGLIYALSWYLDIVSSNWDAIVIGDYETVMPLTWRKKYFIKYLFQHDLTQQLGIFGRFNNDIIEQIILLITKKFRFIDIKLNYQNKKLKEFKNNFTKRTNLIIELNKDTTEGIIKGYSQNAIKNISKAKRLNSFQWSEDDISFINFVNKINPAYFSNDLKKSFHLIIKECKRQHAYRIMLARNHEEEIVAGAFMTLLNKRLTLLLPISSDEGKNNLAMSGIINHIITNNNDRFNILDFEGSDIDGIKRFYLSFGAVEEIYWRFKMNNLL